MEPLAPDHGASTRRAVIMALVPDKEQLTMTIYQAIETKYIGPTNTKPGRIKAECWGGSVTISYPHELNTDEAHAAAARALIEKMTALANRHGGSRSIWNTGHWTQGGNAKGTGYVFTVSDGSN